MVNFSEEDTKISEFSLDRFKELKSKEFVVINYAEADTGNSMHLPGRSRSVKNLDTNKKNCKYTCST